MWWGRSGRARYHLGSVQPGGTAPNGFRWYIEGGAVYARATHIAGGVTVEWALRGRYGG